MCGEKAEGNVINSFLYSNRATVLIEAHHTILTDPSATSWLLEWSLICLEWKRSRPRSNSIKQSKPFLGWSELLKSVDQQVTCSLRLQFDL